MKGHSLTWAFNIIFIIIFTLLLSYSMHIEGLRVLKDQSSSSSSSMKSLIINQAYSGPSKGGIGH